MTATTHPVARLVRMRSAAVLLALGLLLANLALTLHHYDLAVHLGFDECAVCTVASHLGHGLAAASAVPAVAAASRVLARVPPRAVPARFRLRPAARAPPSLITR